MKKFISFALAASMVISMVPATAFAASDLTTSHSNIRVTSDTEFYPETVEGETKRDIPYIRIEAKSDFVSPTQTFELVLENAEWLEDKNNSDKIYMELKEHTAAKIPSKKADGSSSTTPSTPSKAVGELQSDYAKAAQVVKDAAEAYKNSLSSAANSAKIALDKAQEEYNNAVSAESDAQKAYDDAQKGLGNIDQLIADYDAVVAETKDTKTLYSKDTQAPTLSADLNTASSGDEDYINVSGITSYVSPETESLKGMYAISGEGDSAVFKYWNGGSTDTNLSASGVGTLDQALEAIEKAQVTSGEGAVSVAAHLNDSYASDLAAYKTWKSSMDAHISANEFRTEVNTRLNDLAKDIEAAGGQAVSIKKEDIAKPASGALVASKGQGSSNLSKLEAELEEAKKATAKAKTALDEAQAKFDAVNTGDRTALDKAIADRKTAAEALIKVGGQDQGVDFIAKTDKTIFGENNTYSSLGIYAFGITGEIKDNPGSNAPETKALAEYDNISGTELTVDITKKSDTRIIVETSNHTFQNGDILEIPMFIRTTGGVAKISIDSLDSEFTSEGRTFARTADGDTNLSIEKVQNFYDDDEIKNIYIEELVAGTLEPGKYVSLRVNGDFLLKADKNTGVTVTKIAGDGLSDTLEVYKKDGNGDYVSFNPGDDADEIYIKVEGSKTTKAAQFRIQGLHILEDGADFSEEATLTVSGGGTTKQTITVGNYEDYGVSFKAEDKELPVFYAGTRANSKFDNETLKVTIEETVANSFIGNRKMEITLPDGVEFVNDNDNVKTKLSDIDDIVEGFKTSNFQGGDAEVKKAFEVKEDGSKIIINGKDLPEATGGANNNNKDRRRKIEFSVHVSAAADFTGDVVMTLGGAGVGDKELTATVATVKAPIEIKTSVNELMIDYRNTDIADITLVEPEAGLWAKDDVIYLEGERMSFENGAKAEVVSGDMKLDKLDGSYVDTSSDTGYKDDEDVLSVKVSSRSSKTPAEIKISGLSLYMNRSLAAGDYKLKVFGDDKNEFFMNNYHEDGDDYANSFETRKVTVMNDFVKVVTAGRDQDDSTFTTSIVVPVGSTTIQSGTRTINLAEMQGGACPAAYINNDGYTMLPVRAVIEALNGVAVVRWDDSTKTCTVSFGQRVFSMTVGSKVLNMNGVSTALNAAPEIRDSRVFLPLRDLGYALGLSEGQISWDAATQTARLN